MKYICKKRLENILFWFVIIFALAFLSLSYYEFFDSIIYSKTARSYDIERYVTFIGFLFMYQSGIIILGLITYCLFIWSTNLKTYIKRILFSFVLLSFIFKILFMFLYLNPLEIIFENLALMSENIHSFSIFFIFENFHLIFIVFAIWYKIQAIKKNKENQRFFGNIIKLENNDLFVNKTKTTDKFMLFKNGDKKIFFNFENEEKNIKEQIKNILKTDQVKAKMNFKYQFIEKNISQSKFEIIFKSQKEKLKLSFDLYITSEDLILKRTTITKNQLLKEKLEFSLPETSHLLLTA